MELRTSRFTLSLFEQPRSAQLANWGLQVQAENGNQGRQKRQVGEKQRRRTQTVPVQQWPYRIHAGDDGAARLNPQASEGC